MKHSTNPRLLNRRVHVVLVGCGGTGSQMLSGLARLDRALQALDHPGLDITVFDDDTVSESNVGRQLYYPADVGQNKAVTLVTRVNAAFGVRYKAVPRRFSEDEVRHLHCAANILIGAVDTRASRRAILEACTSTHYLGRVDYWLDVGNKASDGQIVLGEPLSPHTRDWHMRLPMVHELFPSVLDEDAPEDDAPSCSLAEALEHQELFINQGVATHALQLLWQLFRHGGVDHSAVFVNLLNGRVSPLAIDREAWLRFGHRTHRKPPERKKAA